MQCFSLIRMPLDPKNTGANTVDMNIALTYGKFH